MTLEEIRNRIRLIYSNDPWMFLFRDVYDAAKYASPTNWEIELGKMVTQSRRRSGKHVTWNHRLNCEVEFRVVK